MRRIRPDAPGKLEQMIVLLVTANPNPCHLAGFQVSNGAVVSPYPDGVKRSLDSLKPNGRVKGIRQPDSIRAISEPLNFERQRTVPRPKFGSGFRNHEADGQSLSVPSRSARSASSIKKSSFPAAASPSICLSQASGASCSRMNAVNSANSCGVSPVTASLISARLIPANLFSHLFKRNEV